ncbi:MAG: transcriptional regulator, partial [Chitinophagales bacterium]
MATVNPKEKLVLSEEKGKGQIVVDYAVLKKAVLALRAMNHPLRKKILELLETNKNLTVTEIYVK